MDQRSISHRVINQLDLTNVIIVYVNTSQNTGIHSGREDGEVKS